MRNANQISTARFDLVERPGLDVVVMGGTSRCFRITHALARGCAQLANIATSRFSRRDVMHGLSCHMASFHVACHGRHLRRAIQGFQKYWTLKHKAPQLCLVLAGKRS